jgi:tetratricopeptide (TPR) repeat protein
MGTPTMAGPKAKGTSADVLVVGVICLAIGLGIGYYFGKTMGSASMPVVTSTSGEAGAPTQTPVMDPAAFMANEASFKSMLNSNPKDLNTLIQLGNLYYDNNKFPQAIDTYARALEIDPNNVNVRTDRGSCYWSLGQADPAIAEFQKSLQLNPTHAQTLFNLGIVYLHGKNDMGEARKAWEKLLASNPDYPQRARLQEMLTSMKATPGMPAEMPAQPAPGAAGKKEPAKPGAAKMEDLFNKMKK